MYSRALYDTDQHVIFHLHLLLAFRPLCIIRLHGRRLSKPTQIRDGGGCPVASARRERREEVHVSRRASEDVFVCLCQTLCGLWASRTTGLIPTTTNRRRRLSAFWRMIYYTLVHSFFSVARGRDSFGPFIVQQTAGGGGGGGGGI
jgi:hypothetical protein